MTALAFHFGLTFIGALQVVGPSVCPTPSEVEAELAKSPPGGGGGEIAIASLEPDPAGGTLRVSLYDASGTERGARELPASGDCRALAMAVATLLRGLDLTFDLAAPPMPLVALQAPPIASPRDFTAFEIGVAGLGSFTGDGSTAGFLALGSMFRPNWVLRPQLTLEGELPRGLAVGTAGQGNWWRIWLAPGGEWRLLRRPSYWLELNVSLPLGASVASGSGYTIEKSGGVFELGASAGLRFGFDLFRRSGEEPSSTLLPWAGVWGIWWPLPHPLTVGNESTTATLPRLEATLGLGVSWSER